MGLGDTYWATVRREPLLASYWRLNDANGSLVAVDLGNFGLNGAAIGTAMSASGPLIVSDTAASSTSFNGSTSYIQVGDISALRIVGDITLEAYVMPTGSGPMIFKGAGSTAGPYSLSLVGAAPTFSVGNGTTQTTVTGTALPLNSPAHVVARVFRGLASLWVNGAQVTTGSVVSQAISDTGNPLLIGKFFNGLMAEVALYSGALSGARIQRHFNLAQMVNPDPAHFASVDPPVFS